jgi:hypothetical protein
MKRVRKNVEKRKKKKQQNSASEYRDREDVYYAQSTFVVQLQKPEKVALFYKRAMSHCGIHLSWQPPSQVPVRCVRVQTQR